MAARALRRALSTARPTAAPRAAPPRPRASFLSTTPAKAAPAPQVSDVTVHITFVDHEGSRAVVPGRVGMTVSEVAELHGIDIGPTAVAGVVERVNSDVWTEDLFGNGPMFGYDHVLIPREWRDKMPPASSSEMELIGDHWDAEDISDSSRLASQVSITADLNGMTVFVPDRIPADIP